MDPVFQPKQIVYLLSDDESLPRIVTAYKVTAYDITYELSCSTVVSWHYEFEISLKKENLKKNNIPGFQKKDIDDPPF